LAVLYSVSETGVHAELGFYTVLRNIREIGWHVEINYLQCVIQCKWKWLMHRITFCSLCYVLKSFSLRWVPQVRMAGNRIKSLSFSWNSVGVWLLCIIVFFFAPSITAGEIEL